MWLLVESEMFFSFLFGTYKLLAILKIGYNETISEGYIYYQLRLIWCGGRRLSTRNPEFRVIYHSSAIYACNLVETDAPLMDSITCHHASQSENLKLICIKQNMTHMTLVTIQWSFNCKNDLNSVKNFNYGIIQ